MRPFKITSDIQDELLSSLKTEGIDESRIADVQQSGYFSWQYVNFADVNKPLLGVQDMYYGAAASWHYEDFVHYLRTGERQRWYSPQVFRVKSLAEAEEILSKEPYSSWMSSGHLCFRGQTKDYTIKRPIPHVLMSDDEGRERMIVPSYWRSAVMRNIDDWPGGYSSLFDSPIGWNLFYHGLSDWRTLHRRNTERYGYHDIEDLEHFPDEESKEFYRRYKIYEYNLPLTGELPLIEQHYGISTNGLDVTYDLSVAMFFATYRFVSLEDGRASFVPSETHEGVVYCIAFDRPKVPKTEFFVSELKVFDHIPPVRPIRQSCALPFFQSYEISATSCHVRAIFIIDAGFDSTGIPSREHLFPGPDEDPFYKVLLEEKRRFPKLLSEVVDYNFS